MKMSIVRVYHESYAVKCECGYETFATGSRARASARDIAQDHKMAHRQEVQA